MFQPLLNSQPINEAHMPSIEATDKSILPVMMINTIGSIIMPNSIKSEAVLNRLLACKKKGDSMILIKLTTIIKATSNHSQRKKVVASDGFGG